MSTRARRPPYQMVRRTRTESSMGLSRSSCEFIVFVVFAGCRGRFRRQQKVAAAATSLQHGLGGVVAKFAAQAVDVDLNEIGKGVKGLVPDMLGNFCAADDATGVTGEEFEEGVFLGGKRNGVAAAFNGLRGSVQGEIANNDLWRTQIVGAPEQCAETGKELAKFKRFSEVVVGAGVETFDAVIDAVSSRQHENGSAFACG